MKYDPNCIHYRDEHTCGCMCNECNEYCPFYDTNVSILDILEEENQATQNKQDFQGSEFDMGVEHQRNRAIEAAKIIINRFYTSGCNPTIDYLKLFIENL